MKFIRYISYLLYSYYSKGSRRNTAYLSAILGITFLVYINLLLISLLLKIEDYIPMSLNESKGMRYMKLALLLSPVFFVLYFGVKEKKLKELKINMLTMTRRLIIGYFYLHIYFYLLPH